MFIENPNDAKKLISLLNDQTSIVNLYYTKPNIHSGKNIPLVMMIFVNQTYYVVSFNHPDAINIPIEFLNLVYETNGKKLIFDRKKLKYHVPKFKNCVDATICSYLSLKSELDGNYIDSRVKDFRSVPIMILFKHFKNLCQSVGDTEYESNLTKYEQDFSNALFGIEKNGLYVTDFNLGDSNLVDNNNLVFSQYNMMTPTGRPSNAFGNINFAALNKKTGQRDCFTSRFGNDGLLIMVDYESYHLRLLANFLEYDLPKTSLHEYLGKYYHGKDTLTEEEYELSKKITFNLIYGGISDDVKENVPFMKTISEYVDSVWNFYNKNKFVETWYYKRKIASVFFGEKINSYKIFNYLLQSAETEKNCEVILKLNDFLKDVQSKMILYTYDAFLFDVHKNDFELIKKMQPIITSNDKYPVRTYMGRTYGDMKQI
tara:strand:- start:1184 stop:2470 length:1287 start_codon:yes stop_codon:yes gene_type:complete